MIEVIQAPEQIIEVDCLNEFAKISYTFDEIANEVTIPKIGIQGGQNIYSLRVSASNGFGLSYSTQWQFRIQIDGIIYDAYSSDFINWTSEDGISDISVLLLHLPEECLKLTIDDSTEFTLHPAGFENEKIFYQYTEDGLNITCYFFDPSWGLFIDSIIYHFNSSVNIPETSSWVYISGGELSSVKTESCFCSFTSKWQAVEHPIKWQLQRKDAIVIGTSLSTTPIAGNFRLELSTTPPTGVVVGIEIDFYDSLGVKRSGIIQNITGNYLIISVNYVFGVVVEYAIFPSLYSNYYIETSILENGTTEIGTLRTIPNSDGSAVVDVHRVLKTKALYDNTYNYTSLTAIDLGMSGKYKLKFRACYNFIKEAYGALTSFAYWSNSAKQIRDLYGSNMAEYVGNLVVPCKFLSVFERPTNFIGYSFSLSYIFGGDFAKQLRKNENSTYTFLTTTTLNTGSVNRLLVSDTATSVSIEYGIPDGLGGFIKQGDLTETKEIKINQACLNNAVALSWLNTLGGREHWVFSYNQIHSIDTGVGATFEPYIDDLQNARSNVFDLERFEQPKITLGASVDIEDIRGLKTILSSICVELQTTSGWIGVRPETGSFKILETKGTTADIEFTIQLPYTNIQSR